MATACSICGGTSGEGLGPNFFRTTESLSSEGKWYHITCWVLNAPSQETEYLEPGLSSYRGSKPPPVPGPPVHRVHGTGSRVQQAVADRKPASRMRHLPWCNSGLWPSKRGGWRISL